MLKVARWLPSFGARRADSRLDTLLEFAPARGSQEELVLWLIDLVAWLRPGREQGPGLRLRYLAVQLERHPEWRANVSSALSRLVEGCDLAQLLAYAGIPRDFHFLGAVSDWFTASVLPAACDTHDAAQIIAMAFRATDVGWLREACQSEWLHRLVAPEQQAKLREALPVALVNLSHEVVAQAHSPVLQNLADQPRSPFRGVHEAVLSLVSGADRQVNLRALTGRLTQCIAFTEALRSGLAQRGASINATFQLLRLRRQLKRLQLLAGLTVQCDRAAIGDAVAELCEQALRGTNGGRLMRGSADLLARNLVDSAAAVGRDYLEVAESSSMAAFRAGAGGGLLMAAATALKFSITNLHLPRLYQGIAHSLNYAAVFCAAYLLHFTIATKLPAHTAAALARDLREGPSFNVRLTRFVATWRAMVRLQLLGLLGNVLVVVPLAGAIALAARAILGHDLLSPEKANQVLHEQSLIGPSLSFAALTGVLLWVSSLLGAFVDNWARVTRLADRLATNVIAMRRFSPARARARANRLVAMTGGLAANVALGFMLGGIPTLFALAEIPLEIRHVTVSAGSVAMALSTSAGTPLSSTLAVTGVVAIGAMNVLMSFSLALWFALLATAGPAGDGRSTALLTLGIRRWARSLVGMAEASPRRRPAEGLLTLAPSLVAPTEPDAADSER